MSILIEKRIESDLPIDYTALQAYILYISIYLYIFLSIRKRNYMITIIGRVYWLNFLILNLNILDFTTSLSYLEI